MTRRTTMRVAPALVFALCTLMGASAAIRAEPEATATGPKVALILPLSGEYRSLGEAAAEGIEWAMAEAPLPLRIERHDTRGDADVAAQLVATLAADPDVVAILGPLGGGESRAAAEAAIEHDVPLLTLTSVEGVEDLGPNVFRLRVSAESQARALAQLAVTTLERGRAAVFYPDDSYGRASMRAFVEAYSAAGGVVTTIEAFDPEESRPSRAAELLSGMRMRRVPRGGGTDVAPQPRTKKRSKAHVDFDTLFVPARGDQVARVLSFLAVAGVPLEGGYRVQLLGTSSWGSGGLKGAETLAAGALVAHTFDAHASDRAEMLSEEFEARFGRQPTALESQAYDGALILSHALRRCAAEPSRGCVSQGLRSQGPVDGVMGPVRLGRRGAPVRELVLYDVDERGAMWRVE